MAENGYCDDPSGWLYSSADYTVGAFFGAINEINSATSRNNWIPLPDNAGECSMGTDCEDCGGARMLCVSCPDDCKRVNTEAWLLQTGDYCLENMYADSLCSPQCNRWECGYRGCTYEQKLAGCVPFHREKIEYYRIVPSTADSEGLVYASNSTMARAPVQMMLSHMEPPVISVSGVHLDFTVSMKWRDSRLREAACKYALDDAFGVSDKTTNAERIAIQERFDENLVWMPALTFNQINVIFTQNPYNFEKVLQASYMSFTEASKVDGSYAKGGVPWWGKAVELPETLVLQTNEVLNDAGVADDSDVLTERRRLSEGGGCATNSCMGITCDQLSPAGYSCAHLEETSGCDCRGCTCPLDRPAAAAQEPAAAAGDEIDYPSASCVDCVEVEYRLKSYVPHTPEWDYALYPFDHHKLTLTFTLTESEVFSCNQFLGMIGKDSVLPSSGDWNFYDDAETSTITFRDPEDPGTCVVEVHVARDYINFFMKQILSSVLVVYTGLAGALLLSAKDYAGERVSIVLGTILTLMVSFQADLPIGTLTYLTWFDKFNLMQLAITFSVLVESIIEHQMLTADMEEAHFIFQKVMRIVIICAIYPLLFCYYIMLGFEVDTGATALLAVGLVTAAICSVVAYVKLLAKNRRRLDSGKQCLDNLDPASPEFKQMLTSAFDSFDIDGSGELDMGEMRRLLRVVFDEIPKSDFPLIVLTMQEFCDVNTKSGPAFSVEGAYDGIVYCASELVGTVVAGGTQLPEGWSTPDDHLVKMKKRASIKRMNTMQQINPHAVKGTDVP
jgi:hypothetical protein